MDILIKGKDVLPPLEVGNMRYIVAEDGTYLERHTKYYHTCCKTDKAIVADTQTPKCTLKIPPLPADICREMICFFQAAYDYHQGESALVLLYNPDKKIYQWYCPEQSVVEGMTGSEVKYSEPLEIPEGFINFGDAHSHAAAGAYASMTDLEDEQFKDGLHIIVGHVNPGGTLNFNVDFVMDGQRFSYDDVEMLPELDDYTEGKLFPEEWMKQITVLPRPKIKKYKPGKPGIGKYVQGYGNSNNYWSDDSWNNKYGQTNYFNREVIKGEIE